MRVATSIEIDFLAKLDDPDTRAVYADWLEQRGDPRAELVRITDQLWEAPRDFMRVRRLVGRRAQLAEAGVGDLAWRLAIARPTFDEIRRRVRVLASLDPGFEIFGATRHAWTLDATLGEPELAEIEARLGAPLPAQYRQLLSEVGNGGAGPVYGLEPIVAADAILDEDDADRVEACGGRSRPIAEIGCGNYYQIVLTGPDAGVVWIACDNEFYPLRADGTLADEAEMRATPREHRLEVLDWYVRWLDEQLWAIAWRTPDRDDVFAHAWSEVTDLNFESREGELPEAVRRFTELRRLSLARAGVTELPPWIGELGKLETLDLGGTALRALPDELCELSALRRLSCSRVAQLTHLPDGFGRLTRLRFLNVELCRKLAALPAAIGELPLDELLVSHCALTTLPASAGKLAKLRSLDLRGNRIATLPDELAGLTELTELCLAENQLTELPPFIGKLPKLERLDLSANPGLDLVGACRILANVPSLRILSLHRMGDAVLPDDLSRLTQLRSLLLDANG